MPSGLDYFNTVRVNRVMRKFQDVREVPQDLLFLRRTPVVPATDNEITARYVIRAQIADIITDDSPSVVYRNGRFDFITHSIPKIKHGVSYNEEIIRQIMALADNGIRADAGAGVDFLGNILDRAVENLLLGIRQRWEAMIIGMKLDSIHYDRLGVKIDAAWGMFQDLKITTAVPWTDAANATPVNDLWAVKLLGRRRYGKRYDRATMTTGAFQAMIATAEFQAKARSALAPNVSYAVIAPSNLQYQMTIAESITGMTIELYDGRYWSEDENGTRNSYNLLPTNRVIVEEKAADNDPSSCDLANAVTTESVVGTGLPNTGNQMATGGGGFRGGMVGPTAYTYIPPNLDPVQMVLYGVARSFPRKWDQASNAVLTVGNIVDPIGVGEPV